MLCKNERIALLEPKDCSGRIKGMKMKQQSTHRRGSAAILKGGNCGKTAVYKKRDVFTDLMKRAIAATLAPTIVLSLDDFLY